MSTPGALTSGFMRVSPSTVIGPLLLKDAIMSEMSTGPTAIPFFSPAGKSIDPSPKIGHFDGTPPGPQFPAAAITITPAFIALLTAVVMAASRGPPRDMLIISALFSTDHWIPLIMLLEGQAPNQVQTLAISRLAF